MIIAVNAVTPAFKPAANNFFQRIFLNIAKQHPEHRFLLIGFDAAQDHPENCIFLAPGKTIQSPLRFLYWLNYQLPALLKKNETAFLFTYNSCSLRLKLPQLLYTDDVSFLTQPELYTRTWRSFYKKNTPKFLHKAVHIAAASAFLQKEITAHYKIAATKLSVVYAAADTVFKPVTHWNQKEQVKDRLCNGREFFLFTGNISTHNNLINLLKAFSFFKQRQKSNMQLVLASSGTAETVFLKSLSSYKYRTDVIVAENITVTELSEITAAAYALVNPVIYDAAGTNVLEALQCGTPVIVSGTAAMPEICGETAAYCNAGDFNDIAAKMMLLFTNEDRRNQYIAKGRDHIRQFEIGHSAGQLWQMARQLVNA